MWRAFVAFDCGFGVWAKCGLLVFFSKMPQPLVGPSLGCCLSVEGNRVVERYQKYSVMNYLMPSSELSEQRLISENRRAGNVPVSVYLSQGRC
jgi:hypothetical protein